VRTKYSCSLYSPAILSRAHQGASVPCQEAVAQEKARESSSAGVFTRNCRCVKKLSLCQEAVAVSRSCRCEYLCNDASMPVRRGPWAVPEASRGPGPDGGLACDAARHPCTGPVPVGILAFRPEAPPESNIAYLQLRCAGTLYPARCSSRILPAASTRPARPARPARLHATGPWSAGLADWRARAGRPRAPAALSTSEARPGRAACFPCYLAGSSCSLHPALGPAPSIRPRPPQRPTSRIHGTENSARKDCGDR
jgi:hypothetical protein